MLRYMSMYIKYSGMNENYVVQWVIVILLVMVNAFNKISKKICLHENLYLQRAINIRIAGTPKARE